MNPMTKVALSSFVFVWVGAVTAFGQALPLDSAVRTGKLANGLTYFIRHNEEPKNRVLIYLVNKVGSVLEDNDQQGLAHFMEHMNFNGTVHFPKNELIDYLQKNGVRFGADINAYTSFDETVFQLPIPSDKPDVLRNGLRIVHDWAQGATLDPVEIDKERGVVLEEKRLGKGAEERMRRVYWPVILRGSRYAVRIPIGLDTVLDHFKPADIRRFYHDWYRPDLQAVIVVGDIDPEAIEREIRAQFADLKNPPKERARIDYKIPLTGSNRFVAVIDPEMTSTQAEVLMTHPRLTVRTVADYRKNIIQELFNQMLQARLLELGRQANPPFAGGSVGIGGFIDGLDVFNASVTARPGDLETRLKAVWREAIRVKQFGFTATELDRAKREYLSAIERAYKEKDKTASSQLLQEYQDYFLKGDASPGIGAEYELTKQELPGIDLPEVDSLSSEYMTDHDRTILIEAPAKDKATLPDSATAVGWLAAVQEEQLTPYQDQVSMKPLLLQKPVPGIIVAEKKDTALGITILTLSNGATVILKPTDFKNDQVLFSAFAPGGTSLSPDSDYQSAANAAAIVGAGGAGNYDQTGLQKYLAGKQVGVRFQLTERSETLNGSSTPGDLATALQLLYANWTEPREDQAVIKGIFQRSRAALANRSNDPNSVFSDSVSAVLGNNNIRRTGPSLEKLAQVDPDKSFRIFKERFSDAAGFTFTFVGSFSIDSIRPLIEKYIASLPSTHGGIQAKDIGVHIPAGVINKTVYKGTEPKATVLLVLSGTFDYSMKNVIQLDALKECLEIRLLQRLREDESGVYSPSVRVNSNKFPQGRYALIISFGCSPASVDKLVASALDEIAKLRTAGPLQENVEKWRAEDRSSRETQLKTNPFWLNYLQGQMENQADLHEISGYNSSVDAVTPVLLMEAAQRYLSGANYIRLELLPETSKP
jgi:zinc protease